MLLFADNGVKADPMNLFRFTIIDDSGGISFVAHADALPALLGACSREPDTLEKLLDHTVPFYQALREYVLNGLAVFAELNTPGHYEVIHQALRLALPHDLPVFRIVDDETREASLQSVKAGCVILNLPAKRIVQIQNTYQRIDRKGCGHVFDGSRTTDSIFYYRLPKEWQLVP